MLGKAGGGGGLLYTNSVCGGGRKGAGVMGPICCVYVYMYVYIFTRLPITFCIYKQARTFRGAACYVLYKANYNGKAVRIHLPPPPLSV